MKLTDCSCFTRILTVCMLTVLIR